MGSHDHHLGVVDVVDLDELGDVRGRHKVRKDL